MKNVQKFSRLLPEKNKRGVSEIIITLIMIGLVLVATAIVWGAVNGVIKSKIDSSKSCFGNFGKVTIEKKYTCYDGNPDNSLFGRYVRVMLNVGDVDIEGVVVSISNQDETKSFKITNTEQTIDGIHTYDNRTSIKLPDKNGGKTYRFRWDPSSAPKAIQIAPIINGNQCDVSDTLSNIDLCATLA